jgi:hypothetical protein
MTVYCPKCGSDDIDALEGPHTISEDETSTILTQQDRCNKCHHVWMDEWIRYDIGDDDNWLEEYDYTEGDIGQDGEI